MSLQTQQPPQRTLREETQRTQREESKRVPDLSQLQSHARRIQHDLEAIKAELEAMKRHIAPGAADSIPS